jgi:hypothetical protein
MPTSAKPRRQYTGRFRLQPGTRKPNLDEAFVVFEPIFRLFQELETGFLDAVNGLPVMMDWNGQWCEIAPALHGWADCWQRISDAEALAINLEPLRRISRKLHAVSPLTPAEVKAGRQAIDATYRAFLTLPVRKIKSHANNEEIAIHLEKLRA